MLDSFGHIKTDLPDLPPLPVVGYGEPLNGNGVPADSLGKDGDIYVDLVSGDNYTKSSGAWNPT